jgi:hypothetical protein
MNRINIVIASLMTALLSMIHSSFAGAMTTDAVSDTSISLSAGTYSTVKLLGTAVNGNQPNQTFVVNYADGSSSSFVQSLSDWCTPQNYAGESQALKMAYRIAPSGATSNGPVYVYGYSFALNRAKTVKSITLPHNRNVVVVSVDLVPGAAGGATPLSVNLSASDNVVGIANTGSPVPNGGFDSEGYAYAANLLGTSLNWAGSTFTLGAAGTSDAVSRTTIALPAGNDSTVSLLAAAVNGNQPNQTFSVTYTDGTSSSFTQSVSDWYTPQNYAGESQALKMAYRIAPSGATSNGPIYVYGYSFALNSAKTVKSITPPNNRSVVVLAVDVSAPLAPVHVNLSTVDNVLGIANEGSPVTNGGLDGDGYAYSAHLIGTSISWSGATYTLGAAATLRISGTPATTAQVGQFYSFAPTVVAPAGSSLAYAVANRPPWARFSAVTGALSGTPAAGDVAIDPNIVVSVSSGTNSVALPAFSIAVAPAPTRPADTASLSWSEPSQNTDGSPLTNLAGYIVRYGTDAAALGLQISLGGPNATDVEIGNLTPGHWYFEVASTNTLGVAGPFSTIVGETIQ